jgi:hypothetical protein
LFTVIIKPRMRKIKVLPLLLLVVFFSAACVGKNADSEGNNETAGGGQEYAKLPWPVLAVLKTGENPIWFEFGQDGPRLIESADNASLTPYAPWPHARNVTAMEMWNGFFVMAVNRDGFLILEPAGDFAQSETTELILYRSAAGSSWDPYTTESFFIWEDKPAVLLYRNDFFGELAAASPNPRVYTLDLSSAVPVGALVPALEIFPSGENWETELLRRGPDGLWYYRMKQKRQDRPLTAYFRTADLNAEGERISLGEWMNADREGDSGNIPGNLAFLQERTEENGPGLSFLPALGEGFVYTDAGVLGNVLIASWEEQQEAAVGAAGFMVVNFTIP